MDYKEVEQLLDKFYNAHTTCPEEQKLYDWLCSEECSEELFIDREIIRTYIQQHPPVDIPKDIELKTLSSVSPVRLAISAISHSSRERKVRIRCC